MPEMSELLRGWIKSVQSTAARTNPELPFMVHVKGQDLIIAEADLMSLAGFGPYGQ